MCNLFEHSCGHTPLSIIGPSQPTVFHGNTCAHEMNVSSTAAVLPLTPSNVDNFLSVIFIGSSKFKPEYLGNMHRIYARKTTEVGIERKTQLGWSRGLAHRAVTIEFMCPILRGGTRSWALPLAGLVSVPH